MFEVTLKEIITERIEFYYRVDTQTPPINRRNSGIGFPLVCLIGIKDFIAG